MTNKTDLENTNEEQTLDVETKTEKPKVYDVYVMVDENNVITRAESTMNNNESRLKDKGYVKIDSGEDIETYGFAQSSYFPQKYGKEILGLDGFNFKLEDGKVVEIDHSQEEEPIQLPTLEERIAVVEELLLETMTEGEE